MTLPRYPHDVRCRFQRRALRVKEGGSYRVILDIYKFKSLEIYHFQSVFLSSGGWYCKNAGVATSIDISYYHKGQVIHLLIRC